DRLSSFDRNVLPLAAPRLRWTGVSPRRQAAVPEGTRQDLVEELAEQLEGVGVVVNAAGVANGSATAGPDLWGANALMPVLVARASRLAGVKRFIHLSSAAAQGPLVLDDTPRTAPFSPYSWSKALGERVLLAENDPNIVIFRSTWVHDAGRPNTL